MSFFLAFLTLFLALISVFMVLVILMQRAKSDGGVGAALGGGVAEAAFGGESANVLTKATQVTAVLFFVLAFGLYLGRLHEHRVGVREMPGALPTSPDLMPTTPDPLAMPPADSSMFSPPAEGAAVPAATIEPSRASPGENPASTPAPAVPVPASP